MGEIGGTTSQSNRRFHNAPHIFLHSVLCREVYSFLAGDPFYHLGHLIYIIDNIGTMDDLKSYTVRVETGEIRLMSQEEVSKLVRTTMARAESGAPNSKTTTKFARGKGTYTIASDLSRRLSLSPRPVRSTRALHLDRNPEELKPPTSKIFQDFRAAVSGGAMSTPPGESRDDCNTFTKFEMKKPSLSRDERFSALVRTVGPTAIDPENDPRDVSFTVSTEVDGPKNMSEKEVQALVRSSIIRAKFNARQRKFRRKPGQSVDAISSPDNSPKKTHSRKFSWSTVEKSDDEDFEDFMDDEVAETKNDVRQEVEKREQCIESNQNAVDEMVNAEKNYISTNGSNEIFITPCSSSKNEAIDCASPTQTFKEDECKHTSRQPEFDLQLLSRVFSAGDTSISDKDICNRVKHSMAKAKMTRQEITDLLEDTPSGVTKLDVASICEGTQRRAKDSYRVFGVKSLSPRRRRNLGLNLTRAEVSPMHKLPFTSDDDQVPADTNVVSSETNQIDDSTSNEIVAVKATDGVITKSEIAECYISTPVDEAGVSASVVVTDFESPEAYPNPEDDKIATSIIDINIVEVNDRELDEPLVDTEVDKSEFVDSSQPFDDQTNENSNQYPNPTSSIAEMAHDIVEKIPEQNQKSCCFFQFCCAPIILSSSSVTVKEELDGASAITGKEELDGASAEELDRASAVTEKEESDRGLQVTEKEELDRSSEVKEKEERDRVAEVSCETIERHQEDAMQIQEMPPSEIDIEPIPIDCSEEKCEVVPNESIVPNNNLENIIDLTDITLAGSTLVSATVQTDDCKEEAAVQTDDREEETAMKSFDLVKEDTNDQMPVVENVEPVSMGGLVPESTVSYENCAVHDEIRKDTVDLNTEPLDSTTADESPCMTCFHVLMNPEMNPEIRSIEERNENKIVGPEELTNEKEPVPINLEMIPVDGPNEGQEELNALIIPDHDKAIMLEAQKEITTLPTDGVNSTSEREGITKEQNSSSNMSRVSKLSKYKRFKEYCEVKAVVTEEFLNEVISRKGSKISVTELAKMLKGEISKTVDKVIRDTEGNETELLNGISADETIQSERSDIEAKIDASLQQNGFCMDFMSIFSDVDLRDADDDLGSSSLFPDDSRAVTWIESVIDAESQYERQDHGTAHTVDADDDQAPKCEGYESEFVASLDENERRRLTFSFSDGRYTGSLSSLDDY